MNQIQKYVEQIVEVCKTQRLRKHVEKIFVLSQTINAAASELEAENAALKERLEEARELNDDATLIITKDEKALRVLASKGDAMRDELQAQLVVLKGRAEKAETEWKYICDNWDGKMKELDEKDVEIARLKASIAELNGGERDECM
jgi:chromosome segregation ATPase